MWQKIKGWADKVKAACSKWFVRGRPPTVSETEILNSHPQGEPPTPRSALLVPNSQAASPCGKTRLQYNCFAGTVAPASKVLGYAGNGATLVEAILSEVLPLFAYSIAEQCNTTQAGEIPADALPIATNVGAVVGFFLGLVVVLFKLKVVDDVFDCVINPAWLILKLAAYYDYLAESLAQVVNNGTAANANVTRDVDISVVSVSMLDLILLATIFNYNPLRWQAITQHSCGFALINGWHLLMAAALSGLAFPRLSNLGFQAVDGFEEFSPAVAIPAMVVSLIATLAALLQLLLPALKQNIRIAQAVSPSHLIRSLGLANLVTLLCSWAFCSGFEKDGILTPWVSALAALVGVGIAAGYVGGIVYAFTKDKNAPAIAKQRCCLRHQAKSAGATTTYGSTQPTNGT